MVSAFVEPTPGGPRLQMHRDSKQSWHLYLSRLPGVALLLTAVRAEVMNTATPEDRETWKEAGILDDVTRIVKSKHAQRDDNVVNLTLDWVSYVQVRCLRRLAPLSSRPSGVGLPWTLPSPSQVDCRVHPLCADPDGLHSHPRRIAIYGSGVRELKGCAGSTDAAVEAFGPESGRVYHDACVQWLTTGELGLLLHVSVSHT